MIEGDEYRPGPVIGLTNNPGEDVMPCQRDVEVQYIAAIAMLHESHLDHDGGRASVREIELRQPAVTHRVVRGYRGLADAVLCDVHRTGGRRNQACGNRDPESLPAHRTLPYLSVQMHIRSTQASGTDRQTLAAI